MSVVAVLKRLDMYAPSTQALLGSNLLMLHCHTPLDLAPSAKIAAKELWRPLSERDDVRKRSKRRL